MIDTSSFPEVLHAPGPAPDRAEKLGLYAFLVGRWDSEIIAHEPSGGATHTARGEIHAGWVLEGRAIQDVWMIPTRPERANAPPMPVAGNWYGTTLRVYDPKIDAWHIFWMAPATSFFSRQFGRARGADIVQEGKHESGLSLRWSFTEITPRSFLWRGEASPDGVTWALQVEVRARRAA
jgi:hypothetical protein